MGLLRGVNKIYKRHEPLFSKLENFIGDLEDEIIMIDKRKDDLREEKGMQERKLRTIEEDFRKEIYSFMDGLK